MSEHPAMISPYLEDHAEQFDDPDQQRHAASLGMWAFLGTEVLFLGAIFVAFTQYRISYEAAFRQASGDLFVSIGAINTGVLLTSSLFVALAVHEAKLGRNKGIALYIGLAILFGLIFLGFKGYEYYLDILEHKLPWIDFKAEGPHPEQQQLFMVFYWFLTGLHATHMVIGTALLSWILFLATRGRFSAAYHNPVEVCGLYWHFVDIVWIFVFPTLYLIHVNPHLL